MTALRAFSMDTVNASIATGIPVIIQSSSAVTLNEFKELTDLPLVQAIEWNEEI